MSGGPCNAYSRGTSHRLRIRLQAGCFHLPIVTARGPASAQHPAPTWVNTTLGNVKRSFHGTSHHLSSEHLPRYFAKFSDGFSRRSLLREMIPRLAFVAVHSSPMPYRVLKQAETYAQSGYALSRTDC